MKIDDTLILKLENLARLELDEAQRKALAGQLEHILAMVDTLNGLDTEGVEPLVYVSERLNAWRDDVVAHQLNRTEALSNAPDQDGVFFKVPKVIDL